ncbi:hypothetical protein ACFU9W_45060 [Streptomyces sp. NPDC057600]|uniref:hypothetical protein n=1 Tax=Streptomyces sp. NPDC057600 TaxID=3346180 RepID=UPI00368F1A61
MLGQPALPELAEEAARLLTRIRKDTARADSLLVQLRAGGMTVVGHPVSGTGRTDYWRGRALT